ncbi:trypsin-like peptidase domain-containing protein [Vibrio furnissii]|uniref:trypsin-like peptidase domain-containing protein n=1 Tax=Vibrio furnissii TaxID=29494 RepID=UPI000200DAC3|nr:trypsin-like peptidase domain-containing protein [Vibrio furnissii]ADT87619.1 SEC-C motif domain protein [Vibrio furnissii NCTC 11218]
MHISDELAFSTVRIECKFADGNCGTGTGFFMSLCVKGEKSIPVIVTNRHVVKGASEGRFCLTLKNEEDTPDIGNFRFFELPDFESQWLFHPEADLAVMIMGPLLNVSAERGERFFYRCLSAEQIPTNEELADMPAMQEIVMVGYPNGIWDEVNNQPVFRKGITATHPELKYNGKPEFLIDAACFNGSSGSPVIAVDKDSITTRTEGTVFAPGILRVRLLGILYAGPQHLASGEVKTVEIGIKKNIALTAIPNNLGNVISSKALLDFEPLLYYIADNGKKPGRLAPCPCQSGKNYKNCHGILA